MTDLATLPTNKHEDWRYSDGAYLAAADLETINHWRTLEVPAGETRFECLAHFGGAAAAGSTDRLRVHIGKNARFECFYLLGESGFQRMEVEVTLDEGAHFEFGGVTVGTKDSTLEFVTRTIHAQPNATSNQVVRAVQGGTSTGNFLGRIEVVRDAQKTDAGQNFRAILLNKGATANTKPELEIFADDVLCAHGAAIGQLDEQAAYYMAARGIPPETARKLQIQAFIGDAFEAIGDDVLREKMVDRALQELDGGAG